MANTLNLFRNGAVGFIGWLGLLPWLVNKTIIVGTIAAKGLPSTPRTPLHIAAEDVQLAFGYAAIVARLSICSPVFLLLPVADALKDFAVDPECRGDCIFCHGAR